MGDVARDLERRGLIQRMSRNGKTSVYRVLAEPQDG
jgi:ribosomal protein S25